MKLLVLAALAAIATADVSHLGFQYGAPASSYDTAQKSVTGDFQSVSSSTPAPDLNLPVHEQQDFQISNFGVSGSSTPAPFLEGGFSFTTPAPNVEINQGLVSSTPASVGFSSTPAPALSFDGGLQGFNGQTFDSGLQGFSGQLQDVGYLQLGQGLVSSTAAPGVSFSSTPSPILNFESGFNAPASYNLGFNSFSTVAPQLSYDTNVATSGGSIVDAFGIESYETQPREQEVSRHLYFYAAPEDPEPVRTRINIAPATPAKKNVKYLFIKAPTAPSVGPVEIAAPPQAEQKTVVYVLVKKPEEEQQIIVKNPEPTEAPKPEVFFIKYKNQKEAEEAINKVQNGQASAEGQLPAQGISGSNDFVESINRESSYKAQPIINYVKSAGEVSTGFSGNKYSLPVVDSGLRFTTSSPVWNQGFGYTTAAPSVSLSPGFRQYQFNAPIQGFKSGFSFNTPTPKVEVNGFGFTTASPTVNIGGNAGGSLFDVRGDVGQNLISSDFGNSIVSSTEAPALVSSTVAPEFYGSSSPVPFSTYGLPYAKK